MTIEDIRTHLSQLKPTWFGKFIYYCMPYRKKIVFKNLNQVFGGKLSDTEIAKMAITFYSHLGKCILENLTLPFLSQEKIKNKARVIGHEKALNAVKNHNGLIILTGHFGNWELGPIGGILNFPEFQGRIHFIRRTQSVEWIGKLLFRRYYRAGLRVIPQKNSLNEVCNVLESNGAVVFVMDQHPPIHSKDGILVDFFGKKAGTYRSVATLAKYTGVPVIPATTYREPDGTHVLAFQDPLPWIAHEDPQTEIFENTRAYNEALEKLVLAHPEQWLWLYKRWKIA